MFSSLNARLIWALVFLSFVHSGCGLRWGEESQVAQFDGFQVEEKCMAGSLELWQRYFDGEASNAEMVRFWDCASDSLKLFTQRTRGARSGEYRPEELRNFLETYFVDENAISDDLLREAMRFKQVLLGGTANRLTVAEITSARGIFERLKALTLVLTPYLPLTPESLGNSDLERLEGAIAALQNVTRGIGEILAESGHPLVFDRLDSLLRAIQPLNDDGSAGRLREILPLAQVLKSILISDDASAVASKEWTTALELGARWYGVVLRVAHLIRQNPEWWVGRARKDLIELVRFAKDLLIESIKRQPNRVVTFEKLDRLIDQLPVRILPGKSPAAWKHVIRPLFRRMLGGKRAGSEGRDADGLTVSAVQRLWFGFLHWSEIQEVIEILTSAQSKWNFSKEHLAQALKVMKESGSFNHIRDRSVRAAAQLIDANFGFAEPGQAEIEFAGKKRMQNYKNLTQLNLFRELTKFLLTGYANDYNRANFKSGITYDEFHCFSDDVREIGIALGRVVAEKYDMHYMRFREANLFTPSSDGDSYFELRESSEMLTLMLSAENNAIRVHDVLDKTCNPSEASDAGNPELKGPLYLLSIPASCYRENYFGNRNDFWKRMPLLLAHYESLDPIRKRVFESSLEIASRSKGVSEDPTNFGDSEAFALILHYLESIFERFDNAPRDGFLDQREAKKAFPVFKRTLSEVVKGMISDPSLIDKVTTDKYLEGLFTYLLAHGKPPETETKMGQFNFWFWVQKRWFWTFKADRTRLLEIFAELASAPRSNGDEEEPRSSCYRPLNAP